MDDIDAFVRDALSILALIGVVVALIVSLGILAGILRSIWRVSFGKATLVLPVGGDDAHAHLNEVIAQQLGEIERVWLVLSSQLRSVEPAEGEPDPLIDLGPLSRALPDATLSDYQEKFILDEPIEGQSIGPISFGGISVAPETLFQLFYRIRSAVARRTIQGSLHQFGDTVRLSAVFVHQQQPGTSAGGQRSRRGRQRDLVILVRTIDDARRLLDVIDDLAFHVAKLRLAFTSEAQTWAAYRALLDGYLAHVQFLRDGQVSNRERAIEFYERALAAEPEYALAHYNLGVLLYNRYLEDANALAIEHFQTASKSEEPMLRALSLSGLAMAYGQNNHRYGLDDASWVSLADEASRDALLIGPELEEVHFARGWALQIADETTEALASYQRAIDLPEDRPSDRQIKSFAQNNRAWLYMTKENDLDTAEQLFHDAVSRFPNKMAHDNLAEIYKRRGEFDRAISEYKAAINLDGRYVNGMNELAFVYLALARRDLDGGAPSVQALLDEAAQWHEKALLYVPESASHQRQEVERLYAEAQKEYGFGAPADAR